MCDMPVACRETKHNSERVLGKTRFPVKPGKTRQHCFCMRTFKMIPGLWKGSHYGMPSVGTGILSRRATLWPRGRDLGVCLIPQQGHPQILTNQNQTLSFVTNCGTKAKSLQVKLPHKIIRKVSKSLLIN